MNRPFLAAACIFALLVAPVIDARHYQDLDAIATVTSPATNGALDVFVVLDVQPFVIGARFDANEQADPSTLEAHLCKGDAAMATYASDAREQYDPLIENGVLGLFVPASQCVDVAPKLRAHLAANDIDADDWDDGTVNCCAPGEELVMTKADLWGEGLYVLCIHVHASHGIVEDYGWFWHDTAANGYGYINSYWTPLTWDGRSPGQDCTELGIYAHDNGH